MSAAAKRIAVRAAIGLGIAVALYAAAGFLLVPFLAERYGPELVSRRLNGQAAVGDVRVNPFLLTAELRDVRFTTQGGAPVAAADRAFVDVAWSSLVRLALVVDTARVEGLVLDVERDASGALNLAALAPKPAEPAQADAQDDGALPPVVIGDAYVDGARIRYVDRTLSPAAEMTVAPVDAEVHGLSTEPEADAGRFALRAVLPGEARLGVAGSAGLAPLSLRGALDLQGLKLAALWPLVVDRFALAPPAGVANAEGRFTFVMGDQGVSEASARDMRLRVDGLALRRAGEDGRRLLELATVEATDGRVRLVGAGSPEVRFATFTAAQGEIAAHIAPDGTLDWSTVMLEKERVRRETSAPLALGIGAVRVAGVAVSATDRSGPQPFAARIGNVEVRLSLEARLRGQAPTAAVSGAEATLSDVAVSAPDGGPPLAALDAITLTGGRVDTAARRIGIGRLALKGGALAAARSENGAIAPLPASGDTAVAAARALQSAPPEPAPKPGPPDASGAAPAGTPWRIEANEIAVENVAARFVDRSTARPLAIGVGALGARLAATAEVGGGGAPQLVVADAQASVDALMLSVPGADRPLVQLDRVTLGGGRLDYAARSVAAERVGVTGGRLSVHRTPEGRIMPLAAIAGGETAAAAKEVAKEVAAAAQDRSPWDYAVAAVAVDDVQLAFEDRTFEPPIAYALGVKRARVENVSTESDAPMRADVALEIDRQGTLRARGDIAQDAASAKLEVDVAGLPLVPLQPLLQRYASLELRRGTASADLAIAFRRGEKEGSRPVLNVEGAVGVDTLLLHETVTDSRFLEWKSLAAKGVRLGLQPDGLAVKEIDIDGLEGALTVTEERRFNLLQVVKRVDLTAEEAAARAARADAKLRKGAAAQPFPLSVERIAVRNGEIDFADYSLVLPFSTRVSNLRATLLNVSNDPERRAVLQAGGRVAPYGTARAKGTLLATSPTEFLDISASFDNLQMPQLSPYSATFAGRTIASGKLWLHIDYRVNHRKLAGSNDIVLEDFELGERVEARARTDLPLELAVALLKDEQGRVHINVPVRGDLDNPKFAFGALVADALGSVLKRVVTAPFRMLAGLVGARPEEFEGVAFPGGSAYLPPPQQETLAKMAAALGKRPELELTIRGTYAAETDAQALGRRAARVALGELTGRTVETRGPLEPIAFDDPQVQRALEQLLTKAAGEGAVQKLAADYAQRTGGAPERANRVLATFGAGAGDSAFYAAVFDRLATLYAPDEGALSRLAAQRAQAIAAQLGKLGIAPDRIATGAIGPVDADQSPVMSELGLQVARGGAATRAASTE